MRKTSILLLLSVVLLATGCTRFKEIIKPFAAPTSASISTTIPPVPNPAVTSIPALVPTTSPTPDFSVMTFVEKNNLYLQLLSERQAEGVNTTAAEEAYTQSLDATLEGNAALADQYLGQAILLLWK